MAFKFEKMEGKRKILVRDVNPMLTCQLCEGYLIDATVLADCLHVFCRGCIIKYFDNCRTACPTCNIVYKKKNQICFRPDPQIQSLIYKLVPSLYSREMQIREDFYRSTGVRASSSCSDDSVIDKERDNLKDQEAWVTSNVGDKTEFFSPEDMISLSIEYYQAHLDTTSQDDKKDIPKLVNHSENDSMCKINSSEILSEVNDTKIETNVINETSELLKVNVEQNSDSKENCESYCEQMKSDEHGGHDDGKRFLKCPAAVSMQLLQKFLRMKFGLTADHRVDIIYRGEVLPNYFTLIDVAYTFKWNRTKPMRFFYRIFTPMKVKPIKIINTTSTSGSKQLQIVQLDQPTKTEKIEKTPEKKFEKPPTPKPESPKELLEDTEDQSYHKERLMAHLQLQSTHKKNQHKNHEKEKQTEKESVCVYEYVEPDKEEIQRFAEKRDREWALQKKLDEKNSEHNDHYFTKKRKKSKHSKNESVHKKRKLHAEITSNEEEDLKLKVKITPHNSHKHKHHKNSATQLRQVRRKQVKSEDKTVQTINTSNISTSKQFTNNKLIEKLKLNKERENEKIKEEESKAVRFVENGTSTTNTKNVDKNDEVTSANHNKVVPTIKENKKQIVVNINKDIKPLVKEWGNNNRAIPTVKIDRMECDHQNNFIKSFQSYTEKFNIEKIKQSKAEARQKVNNVHVQQASRPLTPLEKQINSLPHCTIEPKKTSTPPPIASKREKIIESTPKVLNQYPPGFTVSKIEAGAKRKADNDGPIPDKRPSLEITLIPQTSQSQGLASRVNSEKVVQKRPLPSTIPLDRIRKSINLKSGISIIPKSPDVCDNIGALDLSNKSPESSPKPTHTVTKTVNGINMVITNRNLSNIGQKTNPSSDKPTHQLSNLQMLSKVASEHPILNKLQQQAQNIPKSPRPTIPNLQTLNASSMQNSTLATNSSITTKPNLPKLPKLTEISKTQFKMTSGTQIRTQRPNQNQNIRNIPNPSLLVRQQNQNRLNSLSANVEKDAISVVPSSVSSKVKSIVEKKEIPV